MLAYGLPVSDPISDQILAASAVNDKKILKRKTEPSAFKGNRPLRRGPHFPGRPAALTGGEAFPLNCTRIPGGALSSAFGGSKF